jgi:hypothetical protein
MEHKFQVLSVRAVLKTRTITITCSADVDEDTITADSLYLMHCSTRKIVPMSSEVDRRQIILTLVQEPAANQEYSLVIANTIESIVGDKLDALTSLKITFDSAVITDVAIKEPADFSSYDKAPLIVFEEIGEEENLTKNYQLQIATDNSFCNIDVDTKLGVTEFTPILSDPGQYFVRIRAVKGEDYGTWSKINTFLISEPAPEPVPNPQPEEKPRPGIPGMPEIVDYTKEEKKDQAEDKITPHLIMEKRINCNDEVPEAFEINFDMPVNIDNATIVVKRRNS